MIPFYENWIKQVTRDHDDVTIYLRESEVER